MVNATLSGWRLCVIFADTLIVLLWESMAGWLNAWFRSLSYEEAFEWASVLFSFVMCGEKNVNQNTTAVNLDHWQCHSQIVE